MITIDKATESILDSKAEPRLIVLSDEITHQSVANPIASIIQYNISDHDIEYDNRTPILLYINSGGGDFDSAMALADIITKSRTPVYTYCIGACCSGGALVFISGAKRYISCYAFVMIHGMNVETSGSTHGFAELSAHFMDIENMYDEFIVSKTKITVENLRHKKHTVQDWYLTAEQCLELGIADGYMEEIV